MIKKIIIASSLMLALFGCANSNTIKSKTEIVGKVKDIEITDLRSKRVNGVFVAQATITNTDDEPHDVEYRCHFYDANKFDLSGEVAWTPLHIYGGQKQTVECTSNSQQTSDFKIELSSTGVSVEVYK